MWASSVKTIEEGHTTLNGTFIIAKIGDPNVRELDFYRDLNYVEEGTTVEDWVARFKELEGPHQYYIAILYNALRWLFNFVLLKDASGVYSATWPSAQCKQKGFSIAAMDKERFLEKFMQIHVLLNWLQAAEAKGRDANHFPVFCLSSHHGQPIYLQRAHDTEEEHAYECKW